MNVNHNEINRSFDTDYANLISCNNYKSLKVKNGHIVKKTIFDKFIEFFSSSRSKQSSDLLKDKIFIILESIQQQSINSTKKIIDVLFKIHSLHDSKFIFLLKRKKILTNEIENEMSAKLREARFYKAIASTDEEKEFFRQAIRLEKVKLGLSLGIDFIKNTGSTETVVARNLKGRRFVVFKPTHAHISFFTKIINFFKRYSGQLAYLSKKKDAQSKAEVAAFRLNRYFEFNISPYTTYETLDNKQGAFQRFLKGSIDSKGKKYKYQMFSDEIPTSSQLVLSGDELSAFQKMAVFDYLIGNLDRHEDNWFVKVFKETGEKDYSDIRVIDNANSFLAVNPEVGRIKNQYKWKELNPAQEPLTKEIKNFILKNLTTEKMEAFVNHLKSLPEFKDFLDPSMEENLFKRLNVLRKFAENPKNMTLEDLGNIVSEDDINKFTNDGL